MHAQISGQKPSIPYREYSPGILCLDDAVLEFVELLLRPGSADEGRRFRPIDDAPETVRLRPLQVPFRCVEQGFASWSESVIAGFHTSWQHREDKEYRNIRPTNSIHFFPFHICCQDSNWRFNLPRGDRSIRFRGSKILPAHRNSPSDFALFLPVRPMVH